MPSSTFTVFKSWLEFEAEAVNAGSDTFVVALTNSAPTASTDDLLNDITQVSYTNLSSRTLTTATSAQAAGTYKLEFSDLTLTSTGGPTGPFRYVVVYDDTVANDPLVGFLDYGSSITLADGESLAIDFSTSGVYTKTASP